MNRHWTEDDFIERIYGVGPPDTHLDDCRECHAAWRAFAARRDSLRAAEPPQIPAEVLMSQRREIHRRMERPAKPLVKRVVPVLAAAGMLATALLLVRPSAVSPQPPARAIVIENPSSDAQFFREMAAMAQSSEPRAAKPIEGLFGEE